jgi:type IV pilus assembly protein PilQ
MYKWIYILLFLFNLPVVCASDDPAKVKSINFIQDGEVSKLIVDFDKDVFAERTHLKDDKQIILDLKNVTADSKFLRGIDTSEFSGSAVFVSPYKKPGSKNDLRLAVQLRDNVRSFVEKKRNRIVLHLENRFGVFSKKKLDKSDVQLSSNLEVNNNTNNEKLNIPKSGSIEDILENLTLSGVKRYIGKKISINVMGVKYPELLRMIADTSGFNIIIDDEIKGLKPLTLSLTNIPWDQALDTILSLGSLVGEKHSNILTIKTATKARAEKKIELDQKSLNRIQEPMVTKIFPLSFSKPDAIINIIKDYLTGATTGSSTASSSEQVGTAKFDERTNNLIVKDTVENIERIKKIIETLDTETPQILIQSKIVEVSEEYELRAGLGAGGLSTRYDPFTTGSSIASNSGTFSFSSAPTKSSPSIISGSIDIYKRLTGLNFSLELMESESKGRIVSSPKIITQNNEPATISSEEKKYFLVSTRSDTGETTSNLEEIPAGINMTVTPRVTNDGSISMELKLEKGSFGSQADASQPPPTTSNSIQTKVLVDNGSTIVVGGMFTTTTRTAESGLPFFKDLPLIGWLFRTSYNPNNSKSELVVFITPRVINQEEAGLVNRQSEGLGI